MKSAVRDLVQDVVGKSDEISKGDGWKVLNDITMNTPLQNNAKEDVYRKKISKVMDGVSETFPKEARGSSRKIRVLSTLAPHFKNKELKKAIPCTDYELVEVRKHAQQHGPRANAAARQPVKRFRIPPEDLAFAVNFLHNPENTCRSSHRMASCQGKKSSWVSDLFTEDQQPVMWLKDGKSHLYEKYKEECLKLGCKPISRSKFLNGLSSGKFKEMREMAELCNVCDELGALYGITVERKG